ncbi:MAG: UDP-N-acetylmuramate--L-alanine ligase, partial [Candidatus Omnitrophica bacterium]|nr:UDP-N-acetylmuramate--L-alanine ligase [Candidatus Omnitrophota bacterium]
VGGVGMSALAKVLRHLGHHICGSDAKQSPYLDSLLEKGVKITLNQKEPDLGAVDYVIYSSAISQNHSEFAAARRMGLPLFHRARVLSFILNRFTSMAVTGTHGKTTTSAMLSYLLHQLGARPTCLVGSMMRNTGDNVILGDKNLFVAEVDESDGTHSLYSPTHTLMTNIDNDHMDYYESLDRLVESFRDLASRTHASGYVVYAYEDKKLRAIMKNAHRQKISYGFSKRADFHGESVFEDDFKISYDFYHQNELLGRVSLSVPGCHNVLNSLAVIALLYSLGYDFQTLAGHITGFLGTSRRLEVKYQSKELIVVDDYAHHPTEVEASLAALKKQGRTMCVVFQPHRFSRTQYLAKDFGKAFRLAEEVIVTDIYSAGEHPIASVDAQLIFKEVKASKHPNVRMLKRGDIVEYLCRGLKNYGLVAFLGAGDIGELANDFTGRFEDRA